MCVLYRSFEPTHLLWESELSSERYARTGQLQDEEDTHLPLQDQNAVHYGMVGFFCV